MFWKIGKRNKVKIWIEYDKKTGLTKIEAKPENISPLETIQTLMIAINILNGVIQKELSKKKKDKNKSRSKYVA